MGYTCIQCNAANEQVYTEDNEDTNHSILFLIVNVVFITYFQISKQQSNDLLFFIQVLYFVQCFMASLDKLTVEYHLNIE